MSYDGTWLLDIGDANKTKVDGLVDVKTYEKIGKPLEEVAVMERAELYNADAVFFEAREEGRPPNALAFIFVESHVDERRFAEIHGRLWSWGGVPLAYLVEGALVRLFRCAHEPDFESVRDPKFRPFKVLKDATKVATDPWWSKERLRNGSLWEDQRVAEELLTEGASQKELIEEVNQLFRELKASQALPESLVRKLLVLSLMIAYLEAREVLLPEDFGKCVDGATQFFQVLGDGPGLIALLQDLERRFNGNVFELSDEDRLILKQSDQLEQFARLVEGRDSKGGQRTLWARYSFADLPVELISQAYQLFVQKPGVAVYTPQALVRLMVGEVLSSDRLDRLHSKEEVILDPACGSGVFLVEAYKRLILHWRSKREWRFPSKEDLKALLDRIRGVDLEEGAVELASFSLCLALCDALKPESMRTAEGLFPKLIGERIHRSCFFEALEQGKIDAKVGVIVGNPPFESSIPSGAAQRLYECHSRNQNPIPDKQIAFLFLQESMELLQEDGILSMLQGANFLYNAKTRGFRQRFLKTWDVREILDFTSIRGMFKGGNADPKVVTIVAQAKRPSTERRVLHATFRRTHRARAKQGFDIDYYDLHWIPQRVPLDNDGVWRSNLFGGGRVLRFVDHLKRYETLEAYVKKQSGWRCGEGFITGTARHSERPPHIVGKPLLPPEGIDAKGIQRHKISIAPDEPVIRSRVEALFTPPMVLIREQFNLNHGFWNEYLTFKDQIVGIRGPERDAAKVREIDRFLTREKRTLQAYVAATSIKLFTRHNTSLARSDVLDLPFNAEGSLDLSLQERVVVDDIVDYYRDLIRFGDDSDAMRRKTDVRARTQFNEIFIGQVNGVYKNNPIRALEAFVWKEAKVVCQPFIFGDGEADWEDADELRDKINSLLQGRHGDLNVTRIARLYDGACIYLLKPDRLRYWLRSTALRDADEVLADLWDQGF